MKNSYKDILEAAPLAILGVLFGIALARSLMFVVIDQTPPHWDYAGHLFNTIAPNRLRIIDNRNVVIPKAFFRRYGMFSLSCTAGSEDVKLGFRYQQYDIPIVFDIISS